MKFFDARGCTLEQTAPLAQKEDTSMSRMKRTGPSPVRARAVDWKTDTGTVPAVRLTGLLHTIYVGPSDLPYLENAIARARERLAAQQEQQAQEMAA